MNAPLPMTQVAAAAQHAVDGGDELQRLLQGEYSPRYLLEGDNLDKLERVAKRMASGRMSVPEYLKGNEADCFAIAWQAMLWNMDPFAVAQKTHVVSGRLGYEAQLIIAVVQNSGAIRGAFHFERRGEGPGFECRAGAILRGQSEVTWGEWLSASSVTTKNSPLWKTNPRQQMSYLQAKNWSRLYCPGAILGVYSVDELQDAPPMVQSDAQRGDGVQQAAERPALPHYPDEAFAKNLPAWADLVTGENGKTAEALLAKLSTKSTFSDEQKAKILALKPKAKAPPADAKPDAGPGSDDFAAEYAAAEEAAK